jgi:hypothetical protein
MVTKLFEFENVKIAILKVDDWKENFPQKKSINKLSEKRIIEKESIQFLISKFLSGYKLTYNQNGKPQLDKGGYISISHSKSIIGIAWSFETNLGLDIEEIHARILKVEQRFLNDEEIVLFKTIKDKIKIWCVKEALIKIHDDKTFNLKYDLSVKKLNENNWIGYAKQRPEQQFKFSIFEFCNNIICINLNGEK